MWSQSLRKFSVSQAALQGWAWSGMLWNVPASRVFFPGLSHGAKPRQLKCKFVPLLQTVFRLLGMERSMKNIRTPRGLGSKHDVFTLLAEHQLQVSHNRLHMLPASRAFSLRGRKKVVGTCRLLKANTCGCHFSPLAIWFSSN